jgi:hypothetical protein
MEMETQTAYAKSALSDPSNIINFIALALMMPEVRDIIPAHFIPLVAAIVALANLALRTLLVTHPVAMIAPGQVVPVEVKKLEATKQGSEDADKLPEVMPSGEVPK